ncbi:hypothetical protein ACFYR1_11175 [Streptomyces canus]|uniref:hypothetical protein n=1 Tax=Streptomyces canus TaxID=58343 RepID=UPI0036C32D42
MTANGEATAGGALVGAPGRPARPGAPADYWDRVRRIAAAAPPLSAEQRAVIRSAFHAPEARRAAA